MDALNSSPTTPDLAETRRQLAEQRRRLDRIAQRYQQLDEALADLEALMSRCDLPSARPLESPPQGRPRKPR